VPGARSGEPLLTTPSPAGRCLEPPFGFWPEPGDSPTYAVLPWGEGDGVSSVGTTLGGVSKSPWR